MKILFRYFRISSQFFSYCFLLLFAVFSFGEPFLIQIQGAIQKFQYLQFIPTKCWVLWEFASTDYYTALFWICWAQSDTQAAISSTKAHFAYFSSQYQTIYLFQKQQWRNQLQLGAIGLITYFCPLFFWSIHLGS